MQLCPRETFWEDPCEGLVTLFRNPSLCMCNGNRVHFQRFVPLLLAAFPPLFASFLPSDFSLAFVPSLSRRCNVSCCSSQCCPWRQMPPRDGGGQILWTNAGIKNPGFHRGCCQFRVKSSSVSVLPSGDEGNCDHHECSW